MARTTSTGTRRRGDAASRSAGTRSRRSSSNGATRQGDGLSLLIEDHREVEALFTRYEQLGEGATTRKREVVDRIGELLAIHAGIEETVLYPTIRNTLEESSDDVLEALEEHHLVKTTLAELERTPADDERFDAKVRVLIENVRHHVEEEENELFPHIRSRIPEDLLLEMRELLEAAKLVAPRMAHPHAPDEPPSNLLVTAATLPLDLLGRAAKRLLPGRR